MRLAPFGRAALAAAAVLSVAAAPAGAYRYAPPEFGHCVRAARGESGPGFKDTGCTERVASGARYHWVSGPGSKTGFSASGSADLYQYSGSPRTHASPVVACSSSDTAGTFTGVASESVELVLSGCRMGSSSCQSAGEAAGVVRFAALEGLLTVGKRETWGEELIQWTPVVGETLASFECGSTSVLVTGGVLHQLKRDKMLTSETLQMKVGKEGIQTPSCRETLTEPGETYPGPTCPVPMVSIGAAPPAEGGLSISGTQTDEEQLEADMLLG